MATRRCCPECFGDRGLRDSIFPTLKPTLGTCGFCSSTNVQLVKPRALNEYFELLASVYEPNSDGKPLIEWFRDDWRMFANPRMTPNRASDLLGSVLSDQTKFLQPHIPSPSYISEELIHWETLRNELMYGNRWFLDKSIDIDRLRELLGMLLVSDLPEQWFRARILVDKEPYLIEQMGAPPNRLTGHGRANPPGIPYLYLGSSPETAVSEIRPHTGELACVADFVAPDLRAVDLRNPRISVSPFILADANEIGQLRADLPFLERLGDELTRPVLPHGAAIDYIPSQYLCEFIKKNGFDGVVYRSSVSDGMNLALFKPDRAVGRKVELHKVEKVLVKVARIGDA